MEQFKVSFQNQSIKQTNTSPISMRSRIEMNIPWCQRVMTMPRGPKGEKHTPALPVPVGLPKKPFVPYFNAACGCLFVPK
jgi:hypothetical protein